MPATITGWAGTVKQAGTALVFMNSWEITMTYDTATQGPFLNDSGALYKSRTAKSAKGSAKGVVPSGKDVNQDAVTTAFQTGANKAMTLFSTGGHSIEIGTAIITELKFGHDAKDGPTFEFNFEDSGGFLVDGA
jgi:hypothetical protein